MADVDKADCPRRALRERHRRGAQLVSHPQPNPSFCEPRFDLLTGGCPVEVQTDTMSAGSMRAALLRDGCLLVRGLMESAEAEALAGVVQHAFEVREEHRLGASGDNGLYEEFVPDPGFPSLNERAFVGNIGVWTADSPLVATRVFDAFEEAGIPALMTEYLGEQPVLSVNKSTLRRCEPGPPGTWHQDGAFLGDVRTLNVWLALTECGQDAPGLDVVTPRVDRILPTGTEGAEFDWSVSSEVAEGAAGNGRIVRPLFAPGDAILFDDFCVHRPGSDPAMANVRYAVETWFFGPAGFPAAYVPLAL